MQATLQHALSAGCMEAFSDEVQWQIRLLLPTFRPDNQASGLQPPEAASRDTQSQLGQQQADLQFDPAGHGSTEGTAIVAKSAFLLIP